MSAAFRFSPQTFDLLGAFLDAPEEWRYGYDLSRVTGLKSGTLYPILMRLADRRWLETRWEAIEPGKPPRHMYRLTSDGLGQARDAVEARRPRALQRAAWSGAKA